MRTILFIFAVLTLAACGNSNEQSASAPSGAENGKGLQLVVSNACMSCHQVSDPSVGPSYTAVAARYPNNDSTISMLAEKIIKGGAGHWGNTPMIAHPGLSQEDAKAMVRYILSLK